MILSWVIAFRDSFCKDIERLEVATLDVVHQCLVGKTEENYEKQVGVTGNFTESRNTFHSVIVEVVYSGVDRFYLCKEQVTIIVAAPNRNRGLKTNRSNLLNFP